MREQWYLFGVRAFGFYHRSALVLCTVYILELDIQPARCTLHQAQEAFLQEEDPGSQLSQEAECPPCATMKLAAWITIRFLPGLLHLGASPNQDG